MDDSRRGPAVLRQPTAPGQPQGESAQGAAGAVEGLRETRAEVPYVAEVVSLSCCTAREAVIPRTTHPMVDSRRRGSSGIEVEVNSDELDGVVIDQEPVDGEGSDEQSTGYQHPSPGEALDGLRQAVKVGGKAFNDIREFPDQEVGRGWLSARPSFRTQLFVEPSEEPFANANLSPR